MAAVVTQPALTSLLEMAFSVAVVAGGLLFLGGLVSLGVFLYRSVVGEGMKDPREVEAPTNVDDGITKGDPDDEWDYY